MHTGKADAKDAVQRVKQEIDRLTEEQSEALHLAVYVGMSRHEAKKYDERLETIKMLVDELASLCDNQ
jgi:endonuclease IV